MFECNQDTSLLHQALVSAAHLTSGSLRNLGDLKEKSLNIIVKSLKSIVDHSIDSFSDELSENALKRIIEADLYVNQRMHAAVFFNTLRSYGITCNSANIFYESITHGWPMLDFEFYVELNYRQKWSDYFIQCASQLPSDVLVLVSKNILCASFQSNIRYYSWHLILQTIITKLLSLPGHNKSECIFDFDFESEIYPPTTNILDTELAENDKKTNDEPSILIENALSVKDVFNLLCDILQVDIKVSNDINLIKILLHATKILLKSEIIFSNKDLLKLYALSIECLQLSANVDILKTVLNNYSYQNIDRTYSTAGWNIPEIYLIWILDFHFDYSLSKKNRVNLTLYKQSDIIYPLFVILKDIYPYRELYFYKENDQPVELLYKIIQLNFEGASYAAEILLAHPVLLSSDRTLSVLEENTSTVGVENIYPLLTSIISFSSEVYKEHFDVFKVRLLKYFYKVLAENSTENYSEILKSMLTMYGSTENFQLSDFDEQLSLFLRQTSDEKRSDHSLLSLFVQSPKATLKCVIAEVLCKGQDGKPLIQILKLIPEACRFYNGFCVINPLIEILQQYIESDNLQEYESKNFATLFELLMEVHLETNVLHMDSFIKKCIIPSLKISDKLELILGCLRVIMHHLAVDEAVHAKSFSPALHYKALSYGNFQVSSDTLKILVSRIAQLISCSIESGSGRLKESLILVLNTLENYETKKAVLKGNDKMELQTLFAPLNETLQVYGKEFLPSNTGFKNLPLMWIWCCKFKDFTFIDEQFAKELISFHDLLNTFAQIIPHFTTDEWQFSVILLKRLAEYSYFIEDVIQYSDVPFQLLDHEKSLYAVISCFITSLHFTLPDKVSESLYTSTCFCNGLKKLIKEEKDISLQLLLAIFLDLCYLLSCIEPNLISSFSAVLFELKDRLLLCADKSTESDCQKLISLTLKCLPESSQKADLLQKMKILE